MNTRDFARDAEIAALIASGTTTLDSVAQLYGVSRERIRQLANREGVKTRTHGGALDPIAVLRVIRTTRATSFSNVAAAVNKSDAAVREAVGMLGLTPAVRRLFQWRKAAAWRAKERRLVWAYEREKARLGRPLTALECLSLSPNPQRVYKRNYIARLRRAVGEPVSANAVRYGAKKGEVTGTILALAATPEGCTIPEVLSRVPTTAATVSQTIHLLCKRGAIYNVDGLRGWRSHSTYRVVAPLPSNDQRDT